MSTLGRSPFHVAVFVPDLADSSLGAVSRWNPQLSSKSLLIQSHSGTAELSVAARRVRTNGPASFSVVVEQSSCELIRANAANRWHHIAFFSDDLEGDASRLEKEGYVREVWAQDHTGRLATFVYMLSPNGLRLELTATRSEVWGKAFQAEYDAAVAADLADGVPDEAAQGLPVDHVSAALDDPDAAATALENALDIEWGEPVESEVMLFNDGADRTVATRSITSSGHPALRILHREWAGNPLPAAGEGWDHVAFRSAHLWNDVAALENVGYLRVAYWPPNTDDGEEAVLLAAPEGTRVKLESGGSSVAAPP